MNSVFQDGGALPTDHPTYVERQADHDALRAAQNGEYLHIIAPRQVGKTSLLKHLAARLEEMGWRCAYMDLSTLMDFSKSSWYAELGKALAHSLTPGQIPTLANQVDLRHYLLNQALPWSNGQPRVILLLDEVEGAGKARDADGKPFSDTFFSMFRALYNERDRLPGTLVVVLTGAVNPGDLVKDPVISPFNVGQEIDLDDFTPAEARTLTGHLADLGLPVDKAVHQAIYECTNGHPYLTQRICAELETSTRSGDLTAITLDNVRHIVEQVILNPANPLQRDKNLRHVAKMLNNLSTQAAQLWSRLRGGESVALAETSDDVHLELYLTGAVKLQAGRLVVRSRIYERTFMEKAVTQLATAVDPQPRSEAMGKPIRVFISSTWLDLKPEREAVENALHRMQDTAFAGMEYFGSRPDTPKEVSLAEVDRSDVYIGLVAHRYGSGITEAEYRRARERDIPCLIYFKEESAPVPPAHIERDPDKITRLEALRRDLKQHHTVSFFHSPDHLATQVVADLHNLLGSAPTVRKEEPAQPAPKYQINIGEAQGIVIGDQAQVIQRFGAPAPSLEKKHIRVLVASAWPDSSGLNDNPRTNGEVTWQIISSALDATGARTQVDLLRQATRQSLLSRLLNGYQILHLIANVAPDGTVLLADGSLSPDAFQYLLKDKGLRVLILSSCNSVSVVSALREARVPALIAATDTLRVDVADQFDEIFYGALGAGSPVSEAFRLAQETIRIKFSHEPGLEFLVRPVSVLFLDLREDFSLFGNAKPMHEYHGGQASVTQVFGESGTVSSRPWDKPFPEVSGLRLQHLADNIQQDLELLKDYEDALRYQDDPRQRARYRREIEQLRGSAARYQQEYDELRAQVVGEPPAAMQDVANQLQHMDIKLDTLLNGQIALRDDLTDLRQAVLARFDISEQTIIAAVVKRLDQGQLATVQAVLDAIEAERVQESQLQETLTTVQETLAEIQQRGTAFFDAALVDGAERLSELVDAPKLDVKHKLKITLPIIPTILSYEGVVELKSGLDLEAAWQRLVSKVQGER